MIHVLFGGVLLVIWLVSASEPKNVSYDGSTNVAKPAAAPQTAPAPVGWVR